MRAMAFRKRLTDIFKKGEQEMNLKKLFSTPLKASLTIISLIAIIALLSTGSVYAASSIAQNSSIGAENAKNFSFADAGIDPTTAKALADADVTSSRVTYTEAKLEYDDGIPVYDIEFYTSTHEYEYEINAATGKVHDKDVEKLESNKGNKQKRTDEAKSQDNSSRYIGIDKAKAIAVDYAGLSISDVTFSKAKLDTDDGNTFYEIEFYKDGIEYEYEIDASSGKILEYDTEQDD